MSLRIVCQHCSGELQVPDDAAGSRVRCPFCERIFVCPLAFAPVGAGQPAAARAAASMTYEDAGVWTPRQEELLDESIPWYLVIASFAPLGLLTLVAVDSIAIGLAVVLTAAGLIVATRKTWSILTRAMGIIALALLAMSGAAAAHAFGQGSFANIRMPSTQPPPVVTPPEPAGPDLDQAEWKTWTMPKGEGYDGEVTVLAPGDLVYRKIPEYQHGLDVHLFLLNFPRQKVRFGVQMFDVAAGANPTESAETRGLTLIRQVLAGLLPETDTDPEQTERPLYYGQHPGYEEQRIVLKTTKRVVLNAYLVRDKAFVLSVGAEKYETVKPLAEKFFASFQLTKPGAPMRAAIPQDPDAIDYPAAAPKASLCGHWKSLPPGELAFSADGQWLVTGGILDQVVLWNTKTTLGKFLTTTAGFDTFAIAPSGKHLVTPVPNGFNAPVFVRFPPLSWPAPPLASRASEVAAFKGDTAVVALETNITGWNNEPGENFGAQLWESPRAAKAPIVSLVLSPDGRLMATTSAEEEPKIKLWDASKAGAPIATKEWSAHTMPKDYNVAIQQLAISPASPGRPADLASAGADSTAKLWSLADINNPKLTATLVHDASVACLDFSPDGQRLATGDAAGVVRVWDRSSGKLLSAFRASPAPRPVQGVRFSPDNSLLACAVMLGNQRAGVNLFETKSLPAVNNQQTDEPPLFSSK